MSAPVLRFERFELQIVRRRLLRDGEEVPLRSRAFDLLVALVERAGRVVTKDELLDIVWPGLVVEENNIATQVAGLRKALAGELIVTVPGRGYRFAALPEMTIDAVPQTAPAARASAPARTPALFGRDTDLQRVRHALSEPGCVTIVGPGGVGKTSLARVIADGAAPWPAPPDGPSIPPPPLWVDVATLADTADLAGALARAAGVQAGEALDIAAVVELIPRASPRLIVLDNAEHLVDALAHAAGLLAGNGSALRVLVTSQVPLHIRNEQVERLEPLALPELGASDESALKIGAVAMFVDRVLAADSRWRFAPGSLALVRKLCAALDGLPLALEMAASRVPLLGLQRVHDELNDRFAMLRHDRRDAAARHRTLLAALEWSHALLSPEEQRLYRRLGVFVGGFTPSLAVDVCGEPADDKWDLIDRLGDLVDRSLVSGDHEDPPRYRLLETMRHHALAKLDAAGERDMLCARHFDALLGLAQRASEALVGEPGEGLRRAALDEMDNARAAFEWAVRNAPAQAIALAVERASPVTFTPWRSEVLRWLLAVEPHVGQVDTATRARWSRHCARQLLFAGSSRTFAVAQRAVEESRASGDEQEQFWSIIVLARSWPSERIAEPALQAQIDTLQALVERHPEWDLNAHSVARGTLALLCGKRGDWVAALAHREAELELAHRSGHDGNIGVAQTNLAFALHQLGRNEEAAVRLREFIAAHRGEDSSNVLYAHCMLVRAMLALGRIDDALEHARPALEMCRRYRLAEIEELAALLALRDARPRAAAMLFGYALRVQEELHVRAADSDRGECATLEPRLREALGDPLYERLVVEGRQMADAQADRLLFTRTDAGAEPGTDVVR